MAKVILIYANCNNTAAKGDFSLAGMMAKDLAAQIPNGFKVILTSTFDGIVRYKQLYGDPVNGTLLIEGQSVGLCSLEYFNPVEHEVVAFIEANRCKYAPAELIKRVLSPDSKFLFVGAANQLAIEPILRAYRMSRYQTQQPGIYEYFDSEDTLWGSCGFGADRLGFPRISSITELTELGVEQKSKIPGSGYGFMYVNLIDPDKDYKSIAQFVTLSSNSQYVLVGNFAGRESDVKHAISNVRGKSNLQAPPSIYFHQSVENCLMRNMVVMSRGDLVLSTGVMSTIEAMNDGKLVYYQTISNNANFVTAYLTSVYSMCANDSSLFDNMPKLIMDLSDLLFADKPLTAHQMTRTADLLAVSSVSSKLIDMNKTIIAKANGTLAGQLLSFIGKSSSTHRQEQCVSVCKSLRKQNEQDIPLYDKALRRAAASGFLFEMKVLLRSMSPDEISKPDPIKGLTALHWAVVKKQYDCVSLLLTAHAYIDVKDNDGHVPMYYAVQNADKKMIQLLADAGATCDAAETKDCQSWLLAFIDDCFSHSKTARK